jgi:copper chaperone
MATATLKVSGMSCQHCVRAVRTALESVDGVSRADVDLEAGRARVEYEEGRTSVQQLESAVLDEGYTAEAVS